MVKAHLYRKPAKMLTKKVGGSRLSKTTCFHDWAENYLCLFGDSVS